MKFNKIVALSVLVMYISYRLYKLHTWIKREQNKYKRKKRITNPYSNLDVDLCEEYYRPLHGLNPKNMEFGPKEGSEEFANLCKKYLIDKYVIYSKIHTNDDDTKTEIDVVTKPETNNKSSPQQICKSKNKINYTYKPWNIHKGYKDDDLYWFLKTGTEIIFVVVLLTYIIYSE